MVDELICLSVKSGLFSQKMYTDYICQRRCVFTPLLVLSEDHQISLGLTSLA